MEENPYPNMDNQFSQEPRPAPAKSVIFSVVFTRLLLICCVLLFGIIVGMKVSDYFHGRYFERQEMALLNQAQGQMAMQTNRSPQMGPPQNYSAQPQPSPLLPPAPPASSQPAYPGTPAPAYTAPSPPQIPVTATTQQPTQDGGGMNDQLAALRQEREMVSQRFERLNSGGGSEPPASSPSTPTGYRPSTITSSPAPTNRYDPDEGLTPEELRLRDSPAIAKVTSYNAGWGYITLNAGSNNNLSPDSELAVRRGHKVLGLVKISELYEKDSEAELIGRWRRDTEAPKPQAGDDLLPYPPF